MDYCIECGTERRIDQLKLVYDDPEYGVVAGYVCIDEKECDESLDF